ncbi:MAG: hypothetical protein M3Q06_10285, partial [Bacteroidota bacterium]|nr:hypothetical protein [Bacteroidota bacterium]
TGRRSYKTQLLVKFTWQNMTHKGKHFLYGLSFLMLVKTTVAQSELAAVQTGLSAYVKTYAPEKLFLHTDKNVYTAGDILWLKAYAVDAVFHKPFTASKVAYIELLDDGNVPAARVKIAMNQKGGDGSIQLPFGIKTGAYTLRAYTAWMKNLGAASFFEKRISIINTLKSPEEGGGKTNPAASIQLFPEGGNLVDGLPSTVAFHVVDSIGKGVAGKGFLLNEKNDTLAAFQTHRFGMGQFDLTMQKGATYKVLFQLPDGKTMTQILPESYASGYTMRLQEAANGSLTVQVNTNESGGSTEVFLLAQTRQITKAAQKAITNNGVALFTIDKNILGEGVSQFTVFNREKKPVCERLYFVPPVKKAFNLQAAKANYSQREVVELALTASERDNISLSVFQLDDWQEGEGLGINEYLWLTSELSGPVEAPAYYFSAGSDEVKKAADLLMMTLGWRRFRWEAVQTTPVVKFPLENSGHLVTAKVTDLRTQAPAKDVQVYLSVPAAPFKLFTDISDSTGMVQFDVRDYYGEGELVVQTNTEQDATYKVEIQSPFAETYNGQVAYPLVLNPAGQAALVNRSIGMQALQMYHADSIRRFSPPLIGDTLPFYGKPMYTYDLDDYVRFNTMEEVLREYVREVNVGVKGSGESLRFKLFNQPERRLYQDDILVMVDGIPQFRPNKVFDLDPLKIKSLDVIPRNFVMGHANFHGLANFTSYTGHYEALELDQKAIAVDYAGLQLQRQFYAPVYATGEQRSSRLPDLRTTLYWQPDVASNKVNFYTGDNKGRFVAVLQGLDASGQPVHASVQFDVE